MQAECLDCLVKNYGPYAPAFSDCQLVFYGLKCRCAGDSSAASVIKADGMSCLGTLPNHNPLSWHGVGRGKDEGLKVFRS